MNKAKTYRENQSNKASKNYSNEGFTWILFLVFPILSVLAAIVNFKNRKTRKFIVMSGGLYGLFYTPIPDSDGTRYQTFYQSYNDYSFYTYLDDILNIYSSDNQFQDIYAYTIIYIGNIFSNNPQFFHMLCGLVYFYVFVKLIATVYDFYPKILKQYYCLFFLGLVFILPISAGINGVRWPLAFLVFMYGSINLIMQNKIKFLFIASLSVLIHFSLYPALFILIVFYFFPIFKKTNVLIYFALFALVASSSFNVLVFDNSEFFGQVAESKLNDYTSEGYLDKRNRNSSNWNFYVSFLRFGTYFFSCAALLIMWFNQKKMKTDYVSISLFNFAVLMTTTSFLASTIFDLSTNRYIMFVSFFSLFYLLYMGVLNKKSKTIKILSYVFFPLITLKIFSMIKVDAQTVSIELLTNPFVTFL